MNQRLAALDTIADCLWVDKTPEYLASLEDRISYGKIDWGSVISLANLNLVSPTLWSELQSYGLEQNLPREVREYLGEAHRLNIARNRRLKTQIIEVVSAFNTIDVEPVMLKGAVSLFVKTYQDLGSRMLTDIDILVPRAKAEACWKLLCKQGYCPIEDENDYDWAKSNHLQPLVRRGEYAVVEIHRDALKPHSTGRLFGTSLTQTDSELITQSLIDSAVTVPVDGLTMRVPTSTSRVLHCLLHAGLAEFNAYRSGILPLKSIHELALLQSLFEKECNWDTIAKILRNGGQSRLLHAWVYLAHKLFGSTLPKGWDVTPRMRLHYARCRFQARWGLSITLLHLTRV